MEGHPLCVLFCVIVCQWMAVWAEVASSRFAGSHLLLKTLNYSSPYASD